ncbi:MAG: hypothetical protein NZM42_14325, partial [Gemmatales bacterium]|nr:hypothetical protein [Gemmatales bacterium]
IREADSRGRWRTRIRKEKYAPETFPTPAHARLSDFRTSQVFQAGISSSLGREPMPAKVS